MQITTLEPGNDYQLQEAAKQASQVLNGGGLVVFPTETVYGVGASALSEQGVKRLRDLKNADHTRAFTIHIHDPRQIDRYAELSGGAARRLAVKAMPGPITLLIEVTPELIEQKLKALGLPVSESNRLYHDGVVGLRCPSHTAGQAVLELTGAPVIATSANLPGDPPPTEAHQAAEAIGDKVDMVIDAGPCRYAKPSTIIKLSGQGASQDWTVVREGGYDQRYIKKLARFNILMVCTGNTCRSPMAEGIAKHLIEAHLGLQAGGLKGAGVDVKSAGAFTSGGSPATEEAVDAAASLGVDIRSHRSSQLTRELVETADVIYCMTAGHLQAVLALAPHAAGKAQTLDPGVDINDPIGSGPQVYNETASAIRQALDKRLKEWPL